MNTTHLQPSAPTLRNPPRGGRSDTTMRRIGPRAVMVPNSMSDLSPDEIKNIWVQQGEISAYMKRAEEDRRDLKLAIEKVNDGQDGLRQQFAALQQTSQSTATAMAAIAAEGHGARIAKLETEVANLQWAAGKVKSWDGWIGGAWSFVGKLIIGFVTCSAVAGAVVGLILHALAPH